MGMTTGKGTITRVCKDFVSEQEGVKKPEKTWVTRTCFPFAQMLLLKMSENSSIDAIHALFAKLCGSRGYRSVHYEA